MMMNQPAPVALFVYRRLEHTRQTVEALRRNALAPETDLIVFSDAPANSSLGRAVEEVRTHLSTVEGFRSVSIHERREHAGLAASVIAGVTEVLNEHSRIIVLEDDLVTSSNFLVYMNAALQFYQDKKRVFSVSGYNFPISIPGEYGYDAYFSYRSMSWGWGSWADRWGSVDWDIRDYRSFLADAESRRRFNRGGEDLTEMLKVQMAGKIDSWGIRWCYAHYRHNAFCLYPVISKVLNIGHDASGTHGRKSSRFFVNLDTDDLRDQFRFPETYTVDESIQQAFFAFNRLNPPKRAKYLAKRLVGRKVRP